MESLSEQEDNLQTNQEVMSHDGGLQSELDLDCQLAEHYRELTALTVLLQEQEKAFVARQEVIDWLCRVAIVLHGQPRWWGIMPAAWRAKRERQLLRNRGLFDADGYLRQNPDVAETTIDPLIHYLLHGLGEGRPRGGPLQDTGRADD